MKTYIEIQDTGTKEVVKRMDVTGRTERYKEQALFGILRNLNSEIYIAYEKESKKELPII